MEDRHSICPERGAPNNTEDVLAHSTHSRMTDNVQGRVVLPGSAMLEMASASALALRDDGVEAAAALTDVAIVAPFILQTVKTFGGCA